MPFTIPPYRGVQGSLLEFQALLEQVLNPDGTRKTRISNLNPLPAQPTFQTVCDTFERFYPEHSILIRDWMVKYIQAGLEITPEVSAQEPPFPDPTP